MGRVGDPCTNGTFEVDLYTPPEVQVVKSKKIILLSLIAIIGLLTGAFSSLPVWAKAYYPTAKEMIQKADCIAVVQIEKCAEKETNIGLGYRQLSTASVKNTIKGTLPKTITILGAENFKCAQCSFPAGESMVFLTKAENGSYVGAAWGISNLPITDGNVPWFKDLNSRQSDVKKSLKDVIAEIKNQK